MSDSLVIFSIALLLFGIFSGCFIFGCFYFAFWRGKFVGRHLTNFFDHPSDVSRPPPTPPSSCPFSSAVAFPNSLSPNFHNLQCVAYQTQRSPPENGNPSLRPCPHSMPCFPPPAYDEAFLTATANTTNPNINADGTPPPHCRNKNVKPVTICSISSENKPLSNECHF